MTVRINKQKINLREKLTEFEDKVNFDEVVRGLGENTAPLILNKDGGNVGIGTTSPGGLLELRKVSGSTGYNHLRLLTAGGGLTIGALSDDSNPTWAITTNVNESLAFQIGSNNQIMRIDASGNVGIGTSDTQSRKLNIHGDSTSTVSVASITRNQASAANNTYTLQVDSSSHVSNLTSAGAMSVDVNSGRAFTINGFGNVGIGTTSPSNTLDIYKQTNTTSDNVFTLRSNVGGVAAQIKFKVTADGSAYTGSTPLTSDDRLKHNEQKISEAIQTLGKITPRKYIKTSNLYEADHDFEIDEDGNPVDENGEVVEHRIEAGVIAQEVMGIPELAFTVRDEELDEDGNTVWPYSLDYNSLFTYAIAAIQEQQSIIEDLKSRIETLESK